MDLATGAGSAAALFAVAIAALRLLKNGKALQKSTEGLIDDAIRQILGRLDSMCDREQRLEMGIDELVDAHRPSGPDGTRGWIVRESLYSDMAEVKRSVQVMAKAQDRTNFLLEEILSALRKSA